MALDGSGLPLIVKRTTKHEVLRHTYMLNANIHTRSRRCQITMYVCLRHAYIHAQYAWDIHTYTLSCLRHAYIHAQQWLLTYIHTYTLAWACQTYIHTYMLRVRLEFKHTYIHVWRLARLPEVPPLTNLKKLNWWSNTERFWWGIWHPPKQTDAVGLRQTHIHTYMPRSLRHTYIHSCLGLSDIHTYIHA